MFDDKIPPSGRSYTCKDPECYFCYEMNRDKSERNLIMPKIKPQTYKAEIVIKTPGNGKPKHAKPKVVLLDPDNGVEMYVDGAVYYTGYSYSTVISMISGHVKNYTGLIRVA